MESIEDSPNCLSNDKRHKIDEADLYNSKTCGYHNTLTVLLIYKKSNWTIEYNLDWHFIKVNATHILRAYMYISKPN